jgi:hypothetical protein
MKYGREKVKNLGWEIYKKVWKGENSPEEW